MRFFTRTTRRRSILTVLVLCLCTVLVSGCVGPLTLNRDPAVKTSEPPSAVTVLDDPTAAVLALSASRLMFARSPIVVIASGTDQSSQGRAVKLAVKWGVPLLLTDDVTASAAANRRSVQREVSRLSARVVATVGTVGDLHLRGVRVVDAKSVTHTSTTHPATGGVAAVVVDDPRARAAAATVRAAGADVHDLAAGITDLQSSADAITFLHRSTTRATVLIGAGFSTLGTPVWSVAAARNGYQLAGGGQRLFPDHRFVALYGAPGVPGLGVAGEQDAAATIARAKSVAAPYSGLSTVPVMPMLELIATIAAADAGADGDYSNELPIARLEPLIDDAAAAGIYVVLDLQPGRSSFLDQAKRYLPLLKRPNVGLALDPEWRLGPQQLPLHQIGSVDASEVNAVSNWLSGVVLDGALAPKMLVVHQFTTSMIGNRARLDTSHPQVEIVLHADGQGAQPDKQATWSALHVDAPAGVSWGWKNFYDEDRPMLSPEQTMGGVSPEPQLITYQ